MDGWMVGWMVGWMDGWSDRWMVRWMYGWSDGCTDGWSDGWMDEKMIDDGGCSQRDRKKEGRRGDGVNCENWRMSEGEALKYAPSD